MELATLINDTSIFAAFVLWGASLGMVARIVRNHFTHKSRKMFFYLLTILMALNAIDMTIDAVGRETTILEGFVHVLIGVVIVVGWYCVDRELKYLEVKD